MNTLYLVRLPLSTNCVCVCVCKRAPAHTLTTQLISIIRKPKLVYFGQNNPKVPVEEDER